MAKKPTEIVQQQSQQVQQHEEENPATLLSIALTKGMPVETIEKLMALQERWEANQAKKEFLRAMAEFQQKRPQIKKNKKVGYDSKAGGRVGYTYAELAAIDKQIKGLLGEFGFSYRWEFEESGNQIKCTCFVSHVAGHSESNSMTAPADTSGNKNTIQSIGSTRTYLQRYTLVGVLGLSSADEDDDGRATTKPPIPPPVTKQAPTKQTIPAPVARPVEPRPYSLEASRCNTLAELSEWWRTLSPEQKAEALQIKESRKRDIEETRNSLFEE